MATTKKTVKSDATDKKKTTASKKTTTTKKKTTVKKEVESTGVVDEFLNENIGKVVTETETPKPEKKKNTTTKKTDENKLIDAEAELNEILSQQITEENIRVADAIEKAISEQKELKKKCNEFGLAEDSQEPPQDIATKCEIADVSGEIEVVKPTDDDVKAPEEKWKELGLTEELQSDIQKTVSELYKENQEIRKVDVKNDKPKNIVYPSTEEKNETQEQKKINTVDDLRVNLQPKNEPQRFVYVNTSMGVKYD